MLLFTDYAQAMVYLIGQCGPEFANRDFRCSALFTALPGTKQKEPFCLFSFIYATIAEQTFGQKGIGVRFIFVQNAHLKFCQ